MKKLLGGLWRFLKVLSFDTYLWSISVLGGAILLCVSFFVNPVERFFTLNANVVSANENTIEVVHDQLNYSSVLGVHDGSENIDDGSAVVNVPEQDTPISLDDDLAVSVEDFDSLCRIIECEACSEDLRGRILVGNVVMNRVNSATFPNTIEDVIVSPGQFDPVTSKAYYVATPSTLTKEAAMRVLNGEDYSQGALYFQKSTSTVWGDKTYLFRYNSHSFYK